MKLLRRDQIYYIETDEGQNIPIEEWEAAEILENHDAVYDVIIRHKRKFQFNTAEDSGEIGW